MPLSWPDAMPAAQYQEVDGTLVTHIGGRVRGRHAREAGPNGTPGVYAEFGPNYFERRTHEITIYDDASPTRPGDRVLTIVVRPQWWWYAVNFRYGFVGADLSTPDDPERLALYADNGGVKVLPGGVITRTPLLDYDRLAEPPRENFAVSLTRPPGRDYAFVKQITVSPMDRRPIRSGDIIEFELGIFLARDGVELGRGAYYADAIAYQVGTLGAQPWFRAAADAPRAWDSVPLPAAARQGGAMTLPEDTSAEPARMLMQAATNIAGYNIQPFVEGRRLFHTSFVDGTHSEGGNPVLSNQVNRATAIRSEARCTSCHVANGKSVPTIGTRLTHLAVALSSPGADGRVVPHPLFGTHLQTANNAEGSLQLSGYTAVPGSYPDGTRYELQQPNYTLRDSAGNVLQGLGAASVRVAPHLVGMGLIEAISESTIAALADPDDRDGDGIRGRVSIVRDAADPTVRRLGRFGWRAEAASLRDQIALALNRDMGVLTDIAPAPDCGQTPQGACRNAQPTNRLAATELDLMVRYVALLGVPAPTRFDNGRVDPPADERAKRRVMEGAQLFRNAQCAACHTPAMRTGSFHRLVELRDQPIAPYSNFLLHDMGAQMADATGNAMYRTSPLWGLGKLERINPGTRYLHDGRARSVEEAILWHGGEALRSRDNFRRLSADDRQKLVEFLKSL